MRVGIALGSNLGDRYAFLSDAVDQLRFIHKEGNFLCSSFIETDPMDCPPDSPLFLNAVVELETSIEPLALLDLLQRIEVASGRPAHHLYHEPRSLDLDILYYGSRVVNTPNLQLPHPRIRERLFVLQPLAEIRPDLKLPGWPLVASDYLLKYYNKYIQYTH